MVDKLNTLAMDYDEKIKDIMFERLKSLSVDR